MEPAFRSLRPGEIVTLQLLRGFAEREGASSHVGNIRLVLSRYRKRENHLLLTHSEGGAAHPRPQASARRANSECDAVCLRWPANLVQLSPPCYVARGAVTA